MSPRNQALAKYVYEFYVRNGITSDKFFISSGVEQGGVLSSLLFLFHMEPFINQITMAMQGCYVGGRCAAFFIYADVMLLTPVRASVESRLHMNMQKSSLNKCKLLIFSDVTPLNIQPLFLNGIVLNFDHCEKHQEYMLSIKGNILILQKKY